MKKISLTLLVGSLLLGLVGVASAQNRYLGTTQAGIPIRAQSNVVAISPIHPVTSAPTGTQGYATGGVALRNRKVGVIEISGVVPPVSTAVLYWAYLPGSNPVPATQKVKVKRLQPLPTAGTTVTGTLIALNSDPCWGSANGIAVYRGFVSTAVASGNGAYSITLPATASAVNTGDNPWAVGITFPAAEGASLLLIGAGSSNVFFYDVAPAVNTFFGSASYGLGVPTPGSANVLWDNIGADGQTGGGRTDGLADETTVINGFTIAGPGGFRTDSDWDGSSGFPLPQLWDDTGHDITSVAAGLGVIPVTFNSFGDCISPVANVLSTQ